MGNNEDTEVLSEYRFSFRHGESDFISERHFTAQNLKAAHSTFQFFCRKDEIEPEIEKIDVWNRWANRWECAEEIMDEEADLVSEPS